MKSSLPFIYYSESAHHEDCRHRYRRDVDHVVALDWTAAVLQAAKAFTVRGDESEGVLACLAELDIDNEDLDRLVMAPQ